MSLPSENPPPSIPPASDADRTRDEQRRQLARLLGRILAGHWLRSRDPTASGPRTPPEAAPGRAGPTG